MPKKPPRKPPRRKPPRQHLIDDDLVALAQILDERRVDSNPDGWFSILWRDGWNAVSLALDAYTAAAAIAAWSANVPPEYTAAETLIMSRKQDGQAYHEATDLLGSIPHRMQGTAALRAALRCYQLMITRAHGEHFNEILRAHATDDFTADLVMLWRCRDAIGVFPQLQNDASDRRRRAFTIAWSRGLYHAAYAIGPAKDLKNG